MPSAAQGLLLITTQLHDDLQTEPIKTKLVWPHGWRGQRALEYRHWTDSSQDSSHKCRLVLATTDECPRLN